MILGYIIWRELEELFNEAASFAWKMKVQHEDKYFEEMYGAELPF